MNLELQDLIVDFDEYTVLDDNTPFILIPQIPRPPNFTNTTKMTMRRMEVNIVIGDIYRTIN